MFSIYVRGSERKLTVDLKINRLHVQVFGEISREVHRKPFSLLPTTSLKLLQLMDPAQQVGLAQPEKNFPVPNFSLTCVVCLRVE